MVFEYVMFSHDIFLPHCVRHLKKKYFTCASWPSAHRNAFIRVQSLHFKVVQMLLIFSIMEISVRQYIGPL